MFKLLLFYLFAGVFAQLPIFVIDATEKFHVWSACNIYVTALYDKDVIKAFGTNSQFILTRDDPAYSDYKRNKACPQWLVDSCQNQDVDGSFDCDEYPFASTMEGGIPQTGRCIAACDNRSVGSSLGYFFDKYVPIGEKFEVQLLNVDDKICGEYFDINAIKNQPGVTKRDFIKREFNTASVILICPNTGGCDMDLWINGNIIGTYQMNDTSIVCIGSNCVQISFESKLQLNLNIQYQTQWYTQNVTLEQSVYNDLETYSGNFTLSTLTTVPINSTGSGPTWTVPAPLCYSTEAPTTPEGEPTPPPTTTITSVATTTSQSTITSTSQPPCQTCYKGTGTDLGPPGVDCLTDFDCLFLCLINICGVSPPAGSTVHKSGTPIIIPTNTTSSTLGFSTTPVLSTASGPTVSTTPTSVSGSIIPTSTSTTPTTVTSGSTVLTTPATSGITNTTSSTSTKTTVKTTSTVSSCLSGYCGLGKGNGPTGACCSTSNDCTDTCNSNGICGVSDGSGEPTFGCGGSTKTTTSKNPTATCSAGYSGKKNGGGPTGACCTSSNDCIDTCTNGMCGIAP